jgi:hypothetical protein
MKFIAENDLSEGTELAGVSCSRIANLLRSSACAEAISQKVM